jgi:DNA-binding NarL/FixJ family response regulator
VRLRDTPCETCGWKYPGFHICVDLSKPVENRIQNKHNAMQRQTVSSEQKKRLADGLTERWRKHRMDTRDRDRKIVEAYKSGMGMNAISREFGPAYQTVRLILHRAADRGEITVRAQGANLRWENRQQ